MSKFESAKKGFEMAKKKERPAWVEKAVVTDDLEALRFAAKKSHEAQAKKKDQLAEAEQFYRERAVTRENEEAARSAEIDREHLVPLDTDTEATQEA
ncbi:MAG: hypothetical protein P4L81_04405 [Candidatus Pacebacteria bacterium]|nr:hypothetical protein [Candidatus Paceibacterota bacterium]